MICDWCKTEPADPRYREVIGIEEHRGAIGGTNHIIARRETGKRACATCVRKMRDGVPIGQESLL